MTVSKTLLECWLFKVKDYQRFKKDLRIISEVQRSYRILQAKRTYRSQTQRAKFEQSVADTVLQRYRFLKLKRASLVIQRTCIITNFRQLVKGRMAVRRLIYEEYENRFWKAIELALETRASQSIQNIFRGYLARSTHSYQIEHMSLWKKSFKQNQAACRITAFFRGCYVRLRISKLAKASIKIQKRYRMRIVRKAFLMLREGAIIIQVISCYVRGFSANKDSNKTDTISFFRRNSVKVSFPNGKI